MATEKNITMKQFNGTDYDTLYPKTIASQIPDVYSKSYIDSILKDSAKIQTGSYVGTGTYGANHPCTLTFDFIPEVFFIQNLTSSVPIFPYVWGSNKIYFLSGNYAYNSTVTTSGMTITWYGDNATLQFNKNNETYYYVAIG